MKLKFPPLGNHLLTVLSGRGAAAAAHSDRLRDVLGRDRALVVGARTQTRPSALGASAQPRSATPLDAPAEPPATATSPAPDAPLASAPEPAPEPVAAASAASDERPQRVQHEPIRTRTMARLLASQGYRQRALAIYDELLARPGADETLRAEAETLRLRSA